MILEAVLISVGASILVYFIIALIKYLKDKSKCKLSVVLGNESSNNILKKK